MLILLSVKKKKNQKIKTILIIILIIINTHSIIGFWLIQVLMLLFLFLYRYIYSFFHAHQIKPRLFPRYHGHARFYVKDSLLTDNSYQCFGAIVFFILFTSSFVSQICHDVRKKQPLILVKERTRSELGGFLPSKQFIAVHVILTSFSPTFFFPPNTLICVSSCETPIRNHRPG